MKKKQVLYLLLATAFIVSALNGWWSLTVGKEHSILVLTNLVISMVLVFTWLHLDAAERQYRRPAWLNIGIAALAVVFVPVYLVRSRQKGERLKAVGGFLLFMLLYLAVAFAGAITTIGVVLMTVPTV